MKAIQKLASRRRVLQGVLGGAAVTVGLPFLECFLNVNGNALAATGAQLPVRFGTWLWGMGLAPGRWEPEKVGQGYAMRDLLKSLTPYRDRISIISGMNPSLDGKTLQPHKSGLDAVTTGEIGGDAPSIDVLVADVIGATTRFRSIEVASSMAANANGFSSISRRSATSINPSEASPVALYKRIFGPDFRDPNAADFKPDPRMMVRQSVLTAIKEPRESLARDLGAADRARLDEYFTSLRQIENQVALQLEKPAPLQACRVPPAPGEDIGVTSDVELLKANHKLLVSLLAHAMACDQTRVVNIWSSMGETRRPGDPKSHHIFTHEEAVDEKLGCQPTCAWYEERNMENFAVLLQTLDSIKEGDGTLLDHSLIYAFSEHGWARLHSMENLPMFIAGRAGGRLKPGTHVAAKGDSVTRVGLTIQKVMGVPVGNWGSGSMKTDKTLDEIVA